MSTRACCFSGDDPEYLITGTHAYPSGPGKYPRVLAKLLIVSLSTS